MAWLRSVYAHRVSQLSLLGSIVDLEQYPIDRLDERAGRSLIDECRDQLAEHGVCSLAGFVREDVVADAIQVGDALAHHEWHANQSHNVYFTDLATVAESGKAAARQRAIRSAQRAIAYDLLPLDLSICTLYSSDVLLRFLEQVLGIALLHRSVDPLDAVQLSHFRPGDELGWHFDNSEFSVTLMLREPEAGGHFEWHPGIRSEDDERYDDVLAALDDITQPNRLPTSPGTLAIFQGRHALHRVTPVEGATSRMNIVFTFGTEPDMRLSPLTQLLFYGRNV